MRLRRARSAALQSGVRRLVGLHRVVDLTPQQPEQKEFGSPS